MNVEQGGTGSPSALCERSERTGENLLEKRISNLVEQDPPVPEQGTPVPLNRHTEGGQSGVEQVEQGNDVSANRETKAVLGVKYALEMRDTCLPCSTCSTPFRPTGVVRLGGTGWGVPPRSTPARITEVVQ